MRFDSAEFLFFFCAALVLHRVLPIKRALLIVASYGFYASWNPPFVLLLLASTSIDFAIGRRLEDTEDGGRRRLYLAISLIANLGLLAYFKYVNFLLDNLAATGVATTSALEPFYVQATIPLGISFYTFQTISYTVDVYRRHTPACRKRLDFVLFVAFFPQLIAGPIVRASEFLPQIRRNRSADERQVLEGVELCLVGLFKKVVLADGFGQLVDRCFADPGGHSGAALAVAALAFLVQIYCDFSGYSTMARGIGKLLGYHLPENFDFPLLAGNPIDYRRGWHITMGNWFRDYLYRPLGGSRKGVWRTSFNTLATWMAFGFWHGASWTFMLWGMYQGVLLVVYRLLKAGRLLPRKNAWTTALGYVVFPLFLGLSSILFRSQSVESAWSMLRRIVSWSPGDGIHPGWAVGIAVLYVVHWINKLYYREGLLYRVGWAWRLTLLGGMLLTLFLFAGSGSVFYYFQF